MILVRQEYHHFIGMLKETIQNKNYEEQDDLDSYEDAKNDVDDSRDSSDKNLEDDRSSLQPLIANQEQKEDIFQEQEDDESTAFQFISIEDEKQLKFLRKQTRQVIKTRKKIKQKPLVQKQITQLKKIIPEPLIQDHTFHWPLELHHFWISSLFGARKKANGAPGFHSGIDLAAMRGTPVKAASSGIVVQAQYLPGYGNNILIQHNKYYRTRYAHLDTMNVVSGQKVLVGQKIGTVGATGSVRRSGHDASHLHFEIYHNGSHVNPLRYLFN